MEIQLVRIIIAGILALAVILAFIAVILRKRENRKYRDYGSAETDHYGRIMPTAKRSAIKVHRPYAPRHAGKSSDPPSVVMRLEQTYGPANARNS